MTNRFEFPRARGGRGPQIGPGTFDTRSAPAPDGSSSIVTPDRFEAVVFSAGPGVPATELWCIHKQPDYWLKIENDEGPPPVCHSLFFDKVLPAEEFTPLSGVPLDSSLNLSAFRNFVRARYAAKTGGVETAASEWFIQVSNPFPSDATGPNEKIADGLYRVAQRDRPTGSAPLAWAYVFEEGTQEIWLFWRTGEIDGFNHVGTTPTNASGLYESTEMRFTSLEIPSEVESATDPLNLLDLIKALKEEVAAKDDGTPVYDLDQIEVHHFRVRATATP